VINAKTVKAIRKLITHWRMAVHEQLAVPSKRYSVTVRKDGEEDVVHKKTAIQVRLQAGCPKQLYKRTKRFVSENSKHV
jgi:hypothetical protein